MNNSPIYGLMSNPSMVDFPDCMAAVFFISGCNFRCGYCHNSELITPVAKGYSWGKLKQYCEKFRNNWVDGVVITGGEPTLAKNLPELVDFFKTEGFRVKLDTNGSNPQMLEKLIPKLDYVAMDIKCSLKSYPKLVKFNNLKNIETSINILKQSQQSSYEFRTTIIQSFHNQQEMLAIGKLIRGTKHYVIQPFLPRENLPDPALRTQPRTTPEYLKKLGKLMQPFATKITIRGAGI